MASYSVGGQTYPMTTVAQCLGGETEYITRDGLKTLAETVGTEQYVLSASFSSSCTTDAPSRRGNKGAGVRRGRWVKARIESFGQQRLYAITMTRNGVRKVIYATDGHRWFVQTSKSWMRETTTAGLLGEPWGDGRDRLRPAGHIPTLMPPQAISSRTLCSPLGVMHGFVFGDGHKTSRSGSRVTLWGEKDMALAGYFPEGLRRSDVVTTGEGSTGVPGVEISDLPRYYKDRPPKDEASSYLYGWLAGYFAADGSVGEVNGVATLSSGSRSDLEFARDVAWGLGIGTFGIRENVRLGKGKAPTPLYTMSFVGGTLSPEFFLIKSHRERFTERFERHTYDRLGWKVLSVEETDRFEEVFCAVVPETRSFALADGIWTGNCHTCQSAGRFDIEKMILTGTPYTRIARWTRDNLPEGNEVSIASIRRHFERGHLPYEAEVVRQVLDRKARDRGEDLDSAVAPIVHGVDFAEIVLQKSIQRMANGDIAPTVGDGLKAAQIMEQFREYESGNDEEAYVKAFIIYHEAAQRIMTHEQFEQFGRELAANPLLAALTEAHEAEPQSGPTSSFYAVDGAIPGDVVLDDEGD